MRRWLLPKLRMSSILRFRLRTLFVIVALPAVAFLGVNIWAHRQSNVTRLAEKFDRRPLFQRSVYYRGEWLGNWWKSTVGVNRFNNRIVYLDLSNTSITDKDLGSFHSLYHLATLDLSNTLISDIGLRGLHNLPLLNELNLSQTTITDAGLRHLFGLHPNLQHVDLSHTQISDDGLLHVGTAKRNWAALLDGTSITDEGIRILAESDKSRLLIALSLSDTHVTDESLKHIRRFTRLQYLALRNTDVTDVGLKHLTDTFLISDLFLEGTAVTEEGVLDYLAATHSRHALPFDPSKRRNYLVFTDDYPEELWSASIGNSNVVEQSQ